MKKLISLLIFFRFFGCTPAPAQFLLPQPDIDSIHVVNVTTSEADVVYAHDPSYALIAYYMSYDFPAWRSQFAFGDTIHLTGLQYATLHTVQVMLQGGLWVSPLSDNVSFTTFSIPSPPVPPYFN